MSPISCASSVSPAGCRPPPSPNALACCPPGRPERRRPESKYPPVLILHDQQIRGPLRASHPRRKRLHPMEDDDVRLPVLSGTAGYRDCLGAGAGLEATAPAPRSRGGHAVADPGRQGVCERAGRQVDVTPARRTGSRLALAVVTPATI